MMDMVMRPVRSILRFEPKSDADLAELATRNPTLAKEMRERRAQRPYGHDSILLKCGHVAFRVRPAAKALWVSLPCRMCTLRQAELDVRAEQGERRREKELAERAEARSLGEDVMAKKTATKKAGPKRAWKQSYQWVKALKLEPPKEGVRGVIYAAIRSVKSGTVDDVTAAAVKGGLKNYSKQDPRMMTQSLLRQLAEDGCVKIVREDDDAAPAKKAVPAKKKLVLKKAPAKSEGAAAGA